MQMSCASLQLYYPFASAALPNLTRSATLHNVPILRTLVKFKKHQRFHVGAENSFYKRPECRLQSLNPSLHQVGTIAQPFEVPSSGHVSQLIL